MDKENIEVTITYNNNEYYKNILMDYAIKFILKNIEGSIEEELDGERQ
ncbi:MAG: hypothetical protein Q8936_14635 [Bacillota bacterium]|nr:hypothetical protein [Bacillota bacterium]